MKNTAKKLIVELLTFGIFISAIMVLELAIYVPIYPILFADNKLDHSTLLYIKLGLNIWHLFVLLFIAPKVMDKIRAFLERKMGIERKKDAEQANDAPKAPGGDGAR